MVSIALLLFCQGIKVWLYFEPDDCWRRIRFVLLNRYAVHLLGYKSSRKIPVWLDLLRNS